MKKAIITVVMVLSVFIALRPCISTTYADYDEETYRTVVDIWNYINNAVNSGVNDVRDQVRNLDIEGKTTKGVEKFYSSKTTEENTSNILDDSFKYTEKSKDGKTKEHKGLSSLIISMANDQWKRIGKALEKGGDLSGEDSFNKNLSIESIKKSKVINIFKTFGYSLVSL